MKIHRAALPGALCCAISTALVRLSDELEVTAKSLSDDYPTLKGGADAAPFRA